MDPPKTSEEGSSVILPSALPIKKEKLWFGAHLSNPVSIEASTQPHSFRKDKQPEGKDPAGLQNSSHSRYSSPPSQDSDHCSQQFKPEKYEEERECDSYYSPPPQFFSPPISLNEISVDHHSSSEPLGTSKVRKLSSPTIFNTDMCHDRSWVPHQ